MAGQFAGGDLMADVKAVGMEQFTQDTTLTSQVPAWEVLFGTSLGDLSPSPSEVREDLRRLGGAL